MTAASPCAHHLTPVKGHSTHPKGPTATWQQKPPDSAENDLSGLHQKPQEFAIGLIWTIGGGTDQ